jgi:hypothetical protein
MAVLEPTGQAFCMAMSPQDVRDRLIKTAEHCYYTGPTAGQMWLHDLSSYLQSLPSDDPRLEHLVDDHAALESAERYLCDVPHPLAQTFDPSAWLDDYVTRAA